MKKSAKIILIVTAAVVLMIGVGTGALMHQIKNAIKNISEDIHTTNDTTLSVVQTTDAPSTVLIEPSSDQTTTTPPPSTEAPTTAATTAQPITTAPPATEASADALTVYNQAAAAASFASASYSASMTDIVFSSSLIEYFFDKNEAINTCSVSNAAVPGTLPQISASDVVSAEIQDNGSQYTVTLKMNPVDLAIDAAPPQNGYPFFMDAASVQTQVSKVNNKLEYKNDGSIALSNGVITATVDKATGQMVSATLTLTENCSDGISMGAIGNLLGLSQLTGEFHYGITVQYQ